MTLVIDASVAVKWVLGDRPGEHDTGKALALLVKIGREGILLLQPEHWRVEVLSVVARLTPERFADTLQLLDKLDVTRIESIQVLERALILSRQLKHHLSDTLYHAIAIEYGIDFITADKPRQGPQAQKYQDARELNASARLARIAARTQNDYYDHSGLRSMAMTASVWTIAEAKAKFSEVVNLALSSGPQTITRNGRTTAVIVSAEEWARRTKRTGTLADFFAASPLRGSGLEIERAAEKAAAPEL